MQTYLPDHAYRLVVSYGLQHALSGAPDPLLLDRAHVSSDARSRLATALAGTPLAFDAACEENSIRICVGEIADIWPDRIFGNACAFEARSSAH